VEKTERRLRVLEVGLGGVRTVRSTVPLVIGTLVEIGREAEIGVGTEDPMMSRVALAVTPTDDGWELCVTNRYGGTIYPWGQRPFPAESGLLRTGWPLLGVRLLTGEAAPQHWVLFEGADLVVTGVAHGGPQIGRPGTPTEHKAGVDEELTARQLAALETVFESHLRWPPPTGPSASGLQKQAARKLGISDNAVQQRLVAARNKAIRLGLTERVDLPDPAYLYVLVRAGLVPVPVPER